MNRLKIIARMHSDFPDKFGIPRQSGLVRGLRAKIVFEPRYRNPDALRGLEGFSHIWLIWGFSGVEPRPWTPTVRPPRLGGNARMGVFATRSPYRPNPLGLSCVEIEGIETDVSLGPVIHVLGADLMDQTPIYDIKPYLPFTDSRPGAAVGFAQTPPGKKLEVIIEETWRGILTPDQLHTLREVLAHDPRPPYQQDSDRIYGLFFCGVEVKFRVAEPTLTVTEIRLAANSKKP